MMCPAARRRGREEKPPDPSRVGDYSEPRVLKERVFERCGWAERKDVINVWPLGKMLGFLK